MATKDITDKQVCEAYAQYDKLCTLNALNIEYPNEILHRITGQVEKVCYRAMERAHERGLIDFGVSLRTGWLTEKGKELLK